MMNFQEIVLFAMGQPPGQQPSFFVSLIPFIAMAGIFYFIVLLPLKRRQKKVQEFQSSLKVDDKVVTTSGIHGVIKKVNEKTVAVQIADKVRVEITRSAIAGYQGEDPVVQEGSGS
jgi:preprotein translocase subunit YajC|tara:strand:+ start:937 stop:1284 length:348 start_codon:yes stop_codon:yes gene_type:complete